MINLNFMKSIKRTVIFSLILVLGLGFFVAQNANAFIPGRYTYSYYEDVDEYGFAMAFDGPSEVYYGGGDVYLLEGAGFTPLDLGLDQSYWAHQGNPDGDPAITSIVLNESGTRMYISGAFTEIKGQERYGIAAINPDTGELLDWNPDFDKSPCSDLLISPDNKYIYSVGHLNACLWGWATGRQHTEITKIDAQTGAVMDFDYNIPANLELTGKPLISSDGSKIFVAAYDYDADSYAGRNYRIVEINTITQHARVHYLDFKTYRSRIFASPDFSKIYWQGQIEHYNGHVEVISVLEVPSGKISYYRMPEPGMNIKSVFTGNGDRIFSVVLAEETDNVDFKLAMYNSDFTKYELINIPNMERISNFYLSPNDQYVMVVGSQSNTSYRDILGIMLPSEFSASSAAVTIPGLVEVEPVEDNGHLSASPMTRYYPVGGRLVKEPDSPRVYFISQDKWIYPIQNEEVFLAWGFKWEDIEVVADLSSGKINPLGLSMWAPYQDDITAPANGTLIKGSSPAVYVFVDGKIHAFKNGEIFTRLGFEWNRIITVPDSSIAQMTRGEDISELMHPDGLVIKYANSPVVYIIYDGKKRAFANEDAFILNGFRWAQIIDARADVTYPDGALIEGYVSGI